MDVAFRALAEPSRRQILLLVRDQELTAGQIADRFPVTRPAISQHLTVLRDAGLLSERRDGTRRWYRARPETMAEVRAWLDRFWDDSLERLKVAAETEERRRRAAGKGANDGH